MSQDARPGVYAHSNPGAPESSWHPLLDHLEGTARRASDFASGYAGRWAYLAGLWHDIGKYQSRFQEMIRADADAHCKGRVDHSSAGALLASSKDPGLGLPLSFVIAGHHAGLANVAALRERLETKRELLADARAGGAPGVVLDEVIPVLPAFLSRVAGDEARRALELWIRLLFSALVDADFLDTEAFYRAGGPDDRAGWPSLGTLRERLHRHLEAMSRASHASPVNDLRARVLQACRERAQDEPGVFTLTVPTGGGKTLSSLAFALDHALAHGLKRVVVAIPFTGIIEQTADVYRSALGEDAVLEHHSAVEPTSEDRRSRLACENWDAPVVVTTTVQLFDSLFARKPARCRKLHNLVGSVLVLDEVQTVPPAMLAPILDALATLQETYRVTVVLCTATQPAFKHRPGFPRGLKNVREIAPTPTELFDQLRRVRVGWPADPAVQTSVETLAARMTREERILVVTHTRGDARTLARFVPDAFHLSASMCAEHRSAIVQVVKQRLSEGHPCRLVSTQLIEAGVDVDFPVVLRALGGVDLLAQAAGRCNREGRLGREGGRFEVYVPESEPPRGMPCVGRDVALSMLKAGRIDLFAPTTFEDYFRRLYHAADQDARGVQRERAALNFENVADRFRIIEDDASTPVVVPYGDFAPRLDELRWKGPSRGRLRALQRFLVDVRPWELKKLEDAGALELVADTVLALRRACGLYDERLGLVVDEAAPPKPQDFVV